MQSFQNISNANERMSNGCCCVTPSRISEETHESRSLVLSALQRVSDVFWRRHSFRGWTSSRDICWSSVKTRRRHSGWWRRCWTESCQVCFLFPPDCLPAVTLVNRVQWTTHTHTHSLEVTESERVCVCVCDMSRSILSSHLWINGHVVWSYSAALPVPAGAQSHTWLTDDHHETLMTCVCLVKAFLMLVSKHCLFSILDVLKYIKLSIIHFVIL